MTPPIPAQPGAAPSATQAREYSTRLLTPVHAGMTTPWALAERVRRNPEGTLVARKASLGRSWHDVSARAFRAQVREVAAGLVAKGLEPGDAVGIMSHTSYEWTLMDFAAWEAGLVVVPIYETSSAEQARWILTDASVRLILVENEAMDTLVTSLAHSVPELADLEVLCVEREGILELTKAGKAVDAAELDRRTAELTSQSLATIVYTSGTTGRPKGAELTHGNLVQLCVNVCAHVPEVLAGPHVRLLLFLPLAHVLGRFIEIALVCSHSGVLGHVPDVRNLVTDLGSFRPTAVLAVPRVFEKIYNAADARATGTKQKIFRAAAKTAIAYSRALDTPEGPSRALRARRAGFDRLVFAKLRAILGGQVTHVISGGGPLGERLGHFYRGAGVTVLEGYGLTETMGPCAVNLPRATRIGTVGLPLPGCSIRLADDGEVLVRGIGTFRGYHNSPEATAEAFTADGWLRTGDVASFEGQGFLRITGRKKEIIVTAGGKNVAPAQLEDRLRGHPLVSQVLVVGDNRPCIGALITLDAEMLPLWLSAHGLEEMDVVDAAADPRVRAALERAVARTNESVSRAESIRAFTVLTTDFTVANGLLTPSMKVKRAEVMERFATEIDELYTR
ncbi:long-chain fatty acid--CoA ligase [Actinomyces slackii]|uniref:Long-chain-fatty-acid--CoA ligase FadD15 n=1 Tax=Actinomyces slackii TaxID=52774 RepID=A0A3S4WLP8_9ACTO|nr:long-chain fatty acid--CoA ligase [Actinomyces slackii]VEG75674.1 Long-chain-fatty-acid--CoA ligase FadD15 [Actinomyces slackii]